GDRRNAVGGAGGRSDRRDGVSPFTRRAGRDRSVPEESSGAGRNGLISGFRFGAESQLVAELHPSGLGYRAKLGLQPGGSLRLRLQVLVKLRGTVGTLLKFGLQFLQRCARFAELAFEPLAPERAILDFGVQPVYVCTELLDLRDHL